MTKNNEKCYIGIDVSKAYLDIFVSRSKQWLQFENNANGIKKIIKKFKSYSKILIVMESTAGYERILAQELAKANLAAVVANPRKVRDFAKSLGILAKTDRIDAKVIALYAEKIQPEPNVIYDKNQAKLAEYSARRKQLVDMITAEKNRLDKVSKEMQKSIKQIIKLLEKELEKINAVIAKIIKENREYQRKNELLQTICGVGAVSAAGMIAELPELGNLSAKEISALAGLAPLNRDSGTMRGKRIIWGGRASVRCGLYMATLVATKHNAKIKAFYKKLCVAGKQKKVALIACMHKLLIIMNAMIKHNQPWQSIA